MIEQEILKNLVDTSGADGPPEDFHHNYLDSKTDRSHQHKQSPSIDRSIDLSSSQLNQNPSQMQIFDITEIVTQHADTRTNSEKKLVESASAAELDIGVIPTEPVTARVPKEEMDALKRELRSKIDYKRGEMGHRSQAFIQSNYNQHQDSRSNCKIREHPLQPHKSRIAHNLNHHQ